MRYFSLGQQRILLILAVCLLGILYFKFYYSPPAPPGETVKEIVVEVLGEVGKPGVYIFHHTPSLKEAIEKAGGLNETVSLEPGSSSEILETGTLITIQRKTPSSPVGEGEGEGEGERIKIKIARMEANKLLVFNIPLDLNRVSIEDLCLLPGIGESLAREIISYRQQRKGFRSVEDLKHVNGIGDKKYQSLSNFFVVGNE